MSNKTVLFLVSSNKHTGPGAVALNHALVLREAGWRALFVSQPGNSLQRAAEAAGVWAESGLALPTRSGFWRCLPDFFRLKSFLAEKKVAAIFSYRAHDHLLALLAGTVPIARFVHNARDFCGGETLGGKLHRKLLASSATRQIFLPDPAEVAPLRAWVPNPAISFAPGGVDTARFAPGESDLALRQELGFGTADVVAGIVSRIKPGRGHELFLRAFAAAKNSVPELKALILGDGLKKDRAALLELASSLGVGGEVKVFAPEDRFKNALSVIDVGLLFHPGTAGNARAALELMAFGCPLIVSDRGVLAQLGGETEAAGIVLPVGADADQNAGSFGDVLARLALDPEERLARGLAGRKLVEGKFSAQVLTRLLTGVLENLV